MRKPERRELVVVKNWKGERRAKEVEGEEPHRTTVDLGFPTARIRREDPPGRRGGVPGTGRAPAPSLVIPKEEWRAGSAAYKRALREAQHRHHSAAQQSTAEPSTQDGMHWKQRSKRTRASAFGPGG